MNETHKFTHAVAMIIWWTEGMLSNKPPWWKNDKIKQCHAGFISWCCQHCIKNYYRQTNKRISRRKRVKGKLFKDLLTSIN